MPQLLKKVDGILYDDITDNVKLIKSVIGELQEEDYININGFIAYLQNLSRTEFTSGLLNPINFGLKNSKNLPILTININY